MKPAKPRPAHRPRLGKEPRVTISVCIDETTLSALIVWTASLRAVDPSARTGQLLDRIVNHCDKTKFNPTTK